VTPAGCRQLGSAPRTGGQTQRVLREVCCGAGDVAVGRRSSFSRRLFCRSLRDTRAQIRSTGSVHTQALDEVTLESARKTQKCGVPRAPHISVTQGAQRPKVVRHCIKRRATRHSFLILCV
jgi:hypothetical protein